MTQGLRVLLVLVGGVDKDREDKEDGLDDGLEGLMGSSSEGNKLERVLGVHQDGDGPDRRYDGEVVDQAKVCQIHCLVF